MYQTEEYWDGETYGDWRTSKMFTGVSATFTSGGQIGWYTEYFEVPDTVEELSPLWVVVCIYSTGNTFGRAYGEAEVAAVCTSNQEAEKVQQGIWDDYKNNHRGYGEIVVAGHSIYPGTWKGYFESLEDVRIEKVRVEVE